MLTTVLRRAIGEGESRVKYKIFLFLTFEALLINFSKWAHFLLSSAQLLRYDGTKLALKRMFSHKCMEKSKEIKIDF